MSRHLPMGIVFFSGEIFPNEENHARITNVRTSGKEPHFKTNAQNGLAQLFHLRMIIWPCPMEIVHLLTVWKPIPSWWWPKESPPVRTGDLFFPSVEMVVRVGNSVHAGAIPG